MKNPVLSLLLFCLLLLFTTGLRAQSEPRLGITLSGGGAKGLAHIGVLQVLEENGIYPDMVTGTSMGSIIGGLYAMGYDPQELEALTGAIEWNTYFNDTYPRSFRPVEERDRADRFQLAFAIENGSIRVPRGLILGRKIQALLAGLTTPTNDLPTFDDFFLPYRAVATDLETGEAVVFGEGPLRKAIRASMSIPSVFEPVDYRERLLVDGLLVRNLPVQDAFALGADAVIAVDVGTPLYTRDELGNIIKVLEQTSSFGGAYENERQRAMADVVIDPDLGRFTTLDYNKADSLILLGRRSAKAALPQVRDSLQRLGFTLPMTPPERPELRQDSFYITEVTFEADEVSTRKVLRQLFSWQPPGLLTLTQLNDAIGRLYGSGFFDLVDYQIEPSNSRAYRLRLEAVSRPDWSMGLGFQYDSDFNTGLLVNLTGRNLFYRGSVLSADLRISENPAASLDYLFYTRTNPSLGLRLTNRIAFFPGRIFEDYRLSNEFKFHHSSSSLSLLSGIGRQWYAQGGLLLERLSQNRRFYTVGAGEAVLNQFAGFLSLARDSYDRTYFPESGSLTEGRIQYTISGSIRERTASGQVYGIEDNVMITGRLNKIFPISDDLVFQLRLTGGLINYRQRNFINLLYLGRTQPGQDRFFEVYGLRYMEQPVTSFGLMGLGLRLEVGNDNFIGLHTNGGWYTLSDFNLIVEEGVLTRDRTEGIFSGLGLELGSLTPLGPLRFTTEYNIERSRFNFSLHAGTVF